MIPDRWDQLRALTPARIALGRAGTSVPTAGRLQFQLDHARARDAVDSPFDADQLVTDLNPFLPGSFAVRSAVGDRDAYRRRPDLGSRLSEAGRDLVRDHAAKTGERPAALAVVVADGLSPSGVQRHAPVLVAALIAELSTDEWSVGPGVVISNGRVASGDEIGEILRADFVTVIIGERPGLSAQDSVGIYLTRSPRVGCTNAERNCISNVRPGGLEPYDAGRDLARLLDLARTKGITGPALDTDGASPHQLGPASSSTSTEPPRA